MENNLKVFNINHDIYIQITKEGWEHLKKTVGDDYIKHCIKPYEIEIENQIWHKLQAHRAFELLPISFGRKVLYNTNILISEDDLQSKQKNKMTEEKKKAVEIYNREGKNKDVSLNYCDFMINESLKRLGFGTEFELIKVFWQNVKKEIEKI